MTSLFKKTLTLHTYLLFILIFLYIAYFTTASFLRYDHFYTGKYDLGNMDQAVWNTLQGRFMQINTDEGELISRLSAHGDIILLLLVPLYFFWQDPRMLLLIQTVVLGFGALFVFLIAQRILNHRHLALLFAFLYLLNPSLQYTNLFDFHPVTLATTFLLGACYFLLEKKWRVFLFFLILAAFTKEQLWAVVALFGIYLVFFLKKRIFGFSLFTIGVTLFYLFIWYIIPYFRGGAHFAIEYYGDFGNSPTDIVKNILFHPDRVLATIAEPMQKDYLYKLFFPLGFMSLLAPTFLVFALPDLTINLLSSNTQLHQIYYQYSAVITPFLFISAIFGVKHILRFVPFIKSPMVFSYILYCGIYAAYQFGPLPFAVRPNNDMFIKQRMDRAYIQTQLDAIPKDARVAATNNLGAHLSHRKHLATIPAGIEKTDYLVFYLVDPFAQPSLDAQKEMAKALKNDNRYEIVFEKDDFLVLKRK